MLDLNMYRLEPGRFRQIGVPISCSPKAGRKAASIATMGQLNS